MKFHDSQLNLNASYTRPSTSTQSGRHSQAIKSWLESLSAALVGTLCNSQSPRIRQKTDRLGNHYYRVYDPVTNTHHLFTSEEAVRVWIEQRYYQ